MKARKSGIVPRKIRVPPRRQAITKPFVTRVFTVVRHSIYDKPQGFRGSLTLPGVGIAFRTGEIAAQTFLSKVKNVKARGVTVTSLTSPATRARESTDWFLRAFMDAPVGKQHLSTYSQQKRTEVEPRIQEFLRKDLETERIFRSGDAKEIAEIRKAWAEGKPTGLESREEVDKRYRFLMDRIKYKPESIAPSSPVQLYHVSTHGWIIERMLESLTGKKISDLGGDFATGEGFQVFVYSNGAREFKTLRRQPSKSREVTLR